MNYAMSDLHGRADLYFKMLEKINFSAEDTLYILGDICDRGEDPISIYLDIMNRDNIFCIKGNHEKMLLEALPSYYRFLEGSIPEDVKHEPFPCDGEMWYANGGDITKTSLFYYNRETIEEIYKFIASMPYYREVAVEGTTFVLIHAGPEGYSPEKALDSYTPEELVWYSPDFDATFWEGEKKILIVGHTPTPLITYSRPALIYKGAGNVIAIDCGAVFSGGRLGCLCLDDMTEFYV